MKLRNKKTGEIREVKSFVIDDLFTINSIDDLIEEWEDYKEVDERQYIISDDGDICPYMVDYINEGTDKGRKAIGNVFKTKQEAEKALEKLKAWKRLKDKGFRINKWFTVVLGELQIEVEFDECCGISQEDKKDLDLLFGGE